MTSLQGSGSDKHQLLQENAAVRKALAFVDIYAPQESAKKVHAFLQARREEPVDHTINSDMADTYDSRDLQKTKVYDFKSGGVIEILKQLKLKFEDELEEASKADTAAKSAWTLADATAEDEINAAKKAKKNKEDLASNKGTQKATSNSNLGEATEAKTGATAVLEDLASDKGTQKA